MRIACVFYRNETAMKVLLDTNIIIHRENKRLTNFSIGSLFYWLDNLQYKKCIHPFTLGELMKYRDAETQKVLDIKLCAYNLLRAPAEPKTDFIETVGVKDKHDEVDNALLYQVYADRVGYLITEDRAIRDKAAKLGIADRVFSIDAFISKCVDENPPLVSYKFLRVEKQLFVQIEVKDPFFNSLRKDYPDFDSWFNRKAEEEAYTFRLDTGDLVGFLYLKVEGSSENYSDIKPPFKPKKRLKIGTFKVESTGLRLGERFLKIIFDNALQQKVDEIYVTLFEDREELVALRLLLEAWGFVYHGKKDTQESVYVKTVGKWDNNRTVKKNFPNVKDKANKFILPIFPQYHTDLFPDSQLRTEKIFVEDKAHRYALEKIYVCWSPNITEVVPGDIILIYRTKDNRNKTATFSSVVTSICVVNGYQKITSLKQLLYLCKNRSVFSTSQLTDFWNRKKGNMTVLNLIYLKTLKKKPILRDLYTLGIVDPGTGPRPFTRLTDEKFRAILKVAETTLYDK